MVYSIKLYIDITKSRSLALPTSMLLILLIKSAKEAKFLTHYLIIGSLFAATAAVCSLPITAMVPFASMYASPQSHKLDLAL